MEKVVIGYENSACCEKDGVDDGVQPARMEMDRVIFDAGMTMAKCCGGSNVNSDNFTNIKLTDDNVTTNVCQPKCPAVRASPWDPMKTRFVAALVVAILIWLIFGLFTIKF